MPIMNSVFKIMTEWPQTKILKTSSPLPIYHKSSAINYTHYHIMMGCIVLHSVIHGSTSSLAPQYKFNVLEASNTQSHFMLFIPTQSTHRTHITPQLTVLFSKWTLFLNKRQSVLVAGLPCLRDAPHSSCFFFKISLQNGFLFLDENS